MGISTHSSLGRLSIGPGGSNRLSPGVPGITIGGRRSLLLKGGAQKPVCSETKLPITLLYNQQIESHDFGRVNPDCIMHSIRLINMKILNQFVLIALYNFCTFGEKMSRGQQN
jgi:hypothetical protein